MEIDMEIKKKKQDEINEQIQLIKIPTKKSDSTDMQTSPRLRFSQISRNCAAS